MSTDFKATLWKTADKLRAQMDAAEYKHLVLGLIFLKYISDSFVKQQEKIKEMVSDPESEYFVSEISSEYEGELEERDYYTQDNVFWVPQDARWESLRSKAKQPEIGSIIDSAMTAIENENINLRGKLDKRFGRAQLGQGVLQLLDLAIYKMQVMF
jgi:type I restriction enzyme M protein